MYNPYILPPHPIAQKAAEEVMVRVREYMRMHPESELHRQGKMFGVLVYTDGTSDETHTIAAFSAMLDGSYFLEGYVPPVYAPSAMPIGKDKVESQRLQRLLFAEYNLLNKEGEKKNLLDIFAAEKPIIPAEDWFASRRKTSESLPPSGAGECCAPKLLQYAFSHHWQPMALAEFWMGAPPKNELRREGCFYQPCSGKCRPILRWMLGDAFLPTLSSYPLDPIETIFEDEWLMVINKPAGILSVPGKTGEVCVADILSERGTKDILLAAHRLDQDTSGLLVLAKTPEVYRTLQAYFQRRDILKRYEAVVKGADMAGMKDEGMIDLPLLPDPLDRPRQMVHREHGKPAETDYHVRERRADGSALVDFFPRTGRTHQLRIHAAHPEGLNAPIVGDRLYGGAPHLRLLLHAAEIRFMHPVTKEEMHFCIPSGF